ncbi:MAG: hypothetical protein RSC18_03315 [Raoultibacter sp.]
MAFGESPRSCQENEKSKIHRGSRREKMTTQIGKRRSKKKRSRHQQQEKIQRDSKNLFGRNQQRIMPMTRPINPYPPHSKNEQQERACEKFTDKDKKEKLVFSRSLFSDQRAQAAPRATL